MLTSLILSNYRGFRQHSMEFRKTTVVVGRNNAGKSTMIEALRLVSIVANRYKALTFSEPPSWTSLPKRDHGVRPSLDIYNIYLRTVFHGYGPPPARIEAGFANQSSIEIYIGDDDVFAVVRGADALAVSNKSQARRLEVPPIRILPQIFPVERTERMLSKEYVRKMVGSQLSSMHFRNQLVLFSDSVPSFRELVESTWHGLGISDVDVDGQYPDATVNLLVRDGNFAAELGWMGHGLQMWMQTMWFLTCADPLGTVILDEPDVYMHADLQRRLIRLVKRRFAQAIVATHSVEIMSEVAPDEVLVVERTRRESRFANSAPHVQNVIDHLGGVHNIHLARMWSAKRCLIVEGDDVSLLKIWKDTLFPLSDEPLVGVQI